MTIEPTIAAVSTLLTGVTNLVLLLSACCADSGLSPARCSNKDRGMKTLAWREAIVIATGVAGIPTTPYLRAWLMISAGSDVVRRVGCGFMPPVSPAFTQAVDWLA